MSATPRPRLANPFGLYAIADPDHCAGRDLVDLSRKVLEAGAGILQLRCKGRPFAEAARLARALKSRCTEFGVPFLVNDDARLALEVGADGVHLGQSDMPVAEARALLGPGKIIGLSTHNREQALAGEQSGADYLGFGPIFATTTKENADPALGVEEARWAAQTLRLPFVAIGGITVERLPSLVRAEVRNIAVISAIFAAADPAAAAREFVSILEE